MSRPNLIGIDTQRGDELTHSELVDVVRRLLDEVVGIADAMRYGPYSTNMSDAARSVRALRTRFTDKKGDK
jgi:hypothetical protein